MAVPLSHNQSAVLRHGLAVVGLLFACIHTPPGVSAAEEALPLEGMAFDLWTDGDMLFTWGSLGGRKTRVIFSSVELGSFLSKNCALGKRLGKVWLGEGLEREVVLLEGGSLGGKPMGRLEVALTEEWKPSGARVWRLRDGRVLEEDDTQCIWVVGVAQQGSLLMEFKGGQLYFRDAGFIAEGESIRFAEHPRLGIPFGQFMVFRHGRRIPLRLVLETGRWSSYVGRGVFSGREVLGERFEWEALWLSLETVLPAGNFEFGDSERYGPWADGSVGMKAFECCRLVWSPRQATATVRMQSQVPGEAEP
ncbi:MAG: hypothetical protein FWD46_05645 [Cystobacterineae bacterium]|nr:hypothetical protein [Cystobacterineae bacterium]